MAPGDPELPSGATNSSTRFSVGVEARRVSQIASGRIRDQAVQGDQDDEVVGMDAAAAGDKILTEDATRELIKQITWDTYRPKEKQRRHFESFREMLEGDDHHIRDVFKRRTGIFGFEVRDHGISLCGFPWARKAAMRIIELILEAGPYTTVKKLPSIPDPPTYTLPPHMAGANGIEVLTCTDRIHIDSMIGLWGSTLPLIAARACVNVLDYQVTVDEKHEECTVKFCGPAPNRMVAKRMLLEAQDWGEQAVLGFPILRMAPHPSTTPVPSRAPSSSTSSSVASAWRSSPVSSSSACAAAAKPASPSAPGPGAKASSSSAPAPTAASASSACAAAAKPASPSAAGPGAKASSSSATGHTAASSSSAAAAVAVGMDVAVSSPPPSLHPPGVPPASPTSAPSKAPAAAPDVEPPPSVPPQPPVAVAVASPPRSRPVPLSPPPLSSSAAATAAMSSAAHPSTFNSSPTSSPPSTAAAAAAAGGSLTFVGFKRGRASSSPSSSAAAVAEGSLTCVGAKRVRDAAVSESVTPPRVPRRRLENPLSSAHPPLHHHHHNTNNNHDNQDDHHQMMMLIDVGTDTMTAPSVVADVQEAEEMDVRLNDVLQLPPRHTHTADATATHHTRSVGANRRTSAIGPPRIRAPLVAPPQLSPPHAAEHVVEVVSEASSSSSSAASAEEDTRMDDDMQMPPRVVRGRRGVRGGRSRARGCGRGRGREGRVACGGSGGGVGGVGGALDGPLNGNGSFAAAMDDAGIAGGGGGGGGGGGVGEKKRGKGAKTTPKRRPAKVEPSEGPVVLAGWQPRTARNRPSAPPKELSKAAIRKEVTQLVMDRLKITDKSQVRLIEAEGAGPNKTYDHIRAGMSFCKESIVFHGAPRDACLGIMARGFEPSKIVGSQDDGGRVEKMFYMCTDPAIAERWRRGDYVDDEGNVLRYMVAARMLWAKDSPTKLSGCTGGTIKVGASSHVLLQPMFLVEYESDEGLQETFPEDPTQRTKHTIEHTTLALEANIMRHMIVTRGDIDEIVLHTYFR